MINGPVTDSYAVYGSRRLLANIPIEGILLALAPVS
jgi:hypothetical protein